MLLKARPNFRPFEYPQANKFMSEQIKHPWTPDQISVAGDVQNYHTTFTEAEQHGINTVLKLFTNYEVHVGDYWIDVIYKYFQPYEIRAMATTFAAMEGVHALFYDKLNDALNLSNKEFYLSFTKEPAMKRRMETIEKYLKVKTDRDLPLSLAAFAFVEGVVLYSSFAFLLSFDARSKLTNVATGLRYSVRDENLHAMADCWLFRKLLEEFKIKPSKLENKVKTMAKEFYELEAEIIENIFAKGNIEGISKEDLKIFVKSRINKKLQDLGFSKLYDILENPVAEWFYKDINAREFTDFFHEEPSAYSHKWDFSNVTW